MTKNNQEYNKELILVHQFLQPLYEAYLHSNQIKSNKERLHWSHAIQIIRYIANNCNITDKPNPNNNKKEQLQKKEQLENTEEHTELYNIATTD